MPCLNWSEMATTDFARLDKERCVAVFPLGATVQHGPHLPLMVDHCIAEGVARTAAASVRSDTNALLMPTLTIGKSNEHALFPGTLSFSAPTLIAMLMEIGESVFRTGIKKLLLLNGHGGQSALTQIVVRDLRVKHDALVVAVNWWSARNRNDYFPEAEQAHGIHGGAEETSVMMHLRPELVRKNQIRNFQPSTQKHSDAFPILMGRGATFGWMAQDLNSQGACGDTTCASADLGKQIIDDASRSIADLIEEMTRFPLSFLENDPDVAWQKI
jgi:creatinine amidohydrolase